MNTNVITLNELNTELLRKLLGISMSVSKSETLNFTVRKDSIMGIANDEGDSIYKKWVISLNDICTLSDDAKAQLDALTSDLKCSIYKGEDFSRKILSFFGGFVNIKLEHDDNEITKLDLFKVNDKGEKTLNISLLTATSAIAFVDYDKDIIAQIFEPAKESKLFSFELDINDLSFVSKLAKLNINPDENAQTKWITLYAKDGKLKATDKAFDTVIHEEGQIDFDPIDVSKVLWQMIDKDKYIVNVHDINGVKMLVCESQTKQVVISLLLLAKTDTSINFEDFENNDKTFEDDIIEEDENE